MTGLPLELQQEIISYVVFEIETLRSCVLVCRSWRQYSREYLFRSYTLRSQSKLVHKTFVDKIRDTLQLQRRSAYEEQAYTRARQQELMWKGLRSNLKSPRSPLLLVRHLNILCTAVTPEHKQDYINFLQQLPTLREITFSGWDWRDGFEHYIYTDLATTYSRLTVLTLSGVYIPGPETLEVALLACSSCQSFTLKQINWGYPDRAIRSTTVPPRLRKLSILATHIFPFLGTLGQRKPPIQLESVTLRFVLHEEAYKIPPLLFTLRSTLSNLELSFDNEFWNHGPKLDLSGYVHLQSLIIHDVQLVGQYIQYCHGFQRFFSELSLPDHLSTLVFKIVHPVHPLSWSQNSLCQFLDNRLIQFASKNSIKFILELYDTYHDGLFNSFIKKPTFNPYKGGPWSMTRSDIRALFPKSSQMGILELWGFLT